MKRLMILAIVITSALTACTTLKPGTMGNGGLSQLSGTWELDYISGPRIAFNGLYPAKAPFIKFEISEKRFSGNTSCNSFSGVLVADDTTVNFTGPIILTKMACPGEGELTFLNTLKKVSNYSITSDTTLNFMMGDIAIMRFSKK
ncbi:META domain-containing protein [Pedobacter metabolipauper]|uniref:Heat shock protein HslJ n=1 Tax=Pedobacter metabolipauper TaxID=425513 RepID=A0A4R6SXB0_9SPHI|nr:META domain-containing protein [Pedobacter metabolipauper]TDQ10101.1 heat shock protein HslJ [Pedobacter metabolipauper]